MNGPFTTIVVTDHALQQFGERVDPQRRLGDHVKAIVDGINGINGRIVKRFAVSEGLCIAIQWDKRRGGFTAQCTLSGGVLVVQTITRRHGRGASERERSRVQRRAWHFWVEWCADRGVTPVCDTPADLDSLLGAWVQDHDAQVTEKIRYTGPVVRQVHRDVWSDPKWDASIAQREVSKPSGRTVMV